MGFFDSITGAFSGAMDSVKDLPKKGMDGLSNSFSQLKMPNMDSMKGIFGGGGGGGGTGGGGFNMSGMGMNIDLKQLANMGVNAGMSAGMSALSKKFGQLNTPNMNFGGDISGLTSGLQMPNMSFGSSLDGMGNGLEAPNTNFSLGQALASLGTLGSIVSSLIGNNPESISPRFSVALKSAGIDFKDLPTLGDFAEPKYQDLAKLIVVSHGPELSGAWNVNPSGAFQAVASAHPNFGEKLGTYLAAEKSYLDTHDNPPAESPHPTLDILDAKQKMMGEQARILLEGQDPAAYAKISGDPLRAMEVLEQKYPKLYLRMVKYTETHVVPK